LPKIASQKFGLQPKLAALTCRALTNKLGLEELPKMNKPKVWPTTKIDCPNMQGLSANKLGIGELPKIASQSLAFNQN
jgi:hypothetical protein